MAILVTGGCGYIGSATVEALVEKKEPLVVLDNLSRGHHQAIPSDIPFYQGDIGNRKLVKQITHEHNIEACIHFAAYAYVGESMTNPKLYFQNNVEQGTALIDTLQGSGVDKIVFSSTCSSYGEPQKIPLDENHPQKPVNPYGWSKFMVERMLEAYDQAYEMRFVALRYFNAAGATKRCGEDHNPEFHLIPNVLNVARKLKPYISVFGTEYPTPDGTAVRDYIHIADLASAHILALEHLRQGGQSESINLGNAKGYSVFEVIEAARKITGQTIKIKLEEPREGDPSQLIAQADKARNVLVWKPTIPALEPIIQSAWNWHLAHPNGYEQHS